MFAFYVKRLLMSNLNLVAMLSCVTSVHKEPRSVQPARYLITNNAVNFFVVVNVGGNKVARIMNSTEVQNPRHKLDDKCLCL